MRKPQEKLSYPLPSLHQPTPYTQQQIPGTSDSSRIPSEGRNTETKAVSLKESGDTEHHLGTKVNF